jgi:uncharacterized protein
MVSHIAAVCVRLNLVAVPNPLTPDAVIAALRAHAAELQRAGVRHLGLFGSLARGEAAAHSDVDLVAELDPDARIGLFGLVGLERRLAEILGCNVDLLPEPIEQPRLRANVVRDRRSAF